ncbi:Lrp/AsnC family transcriptional regulator [archaeon]|nr:Lrp/AsnC family transcriptional regulator [archaeon]
MINVEPGALESVTKKIPEMKNVKDVAVVTGAYDILVKIEGEYITEVLTTVVRGIRQIGGVTSTETLVEVKL